MGLKFSTPRGTSCQPISLIKLQDRAPERIDAVLKAKDDLIKYYIALLFIIIIIIIIITTCHLAHAFIQSDLTVN